MFGPALCRLANVIDWNTLGIYTIFLLGMLSNWDLYAFFTNMDVSIIRHNVITCSNVGCVSAYIAAILLSSRLAM